MTADLGRRTDRTAWGDVGMAAAAGPPCIHTLVARQAERTPDAVAVSHGPRTLTYRQLDAAAEALGHALRSAGVRGGAPVAVVMERSVELVVVLTAILKAGGAYLHLDPREPAEQRSRILADAGARVAVVDDGAEDAVPDVEHVVPAPRCGPDAGPGSTPVARVDAAETGPDTPAYVCYTSGSTGLPKGVVVPHRAVHRLVHAPSWLEVRDDDVFFQFTRVGFDVSTFEIWMPLVRGCRLALAPPGPADLAEIVRVLGEEGVTVLWLTTGLFHTLVTHHLDGLGGVRHLLAGGDVLSPEHVRRLMAAHPHLVFTNGYGPTENTTFTTCWTTRVASQGPRVPIGVPIDGTTAAVLDDGLGPVAAGGVGELWVGGAGVATGYLGKPAATAEKFVADPFGPPGSRMYRTGDLARQEPDGTLDFLGRSDRQVKIRGHRVEPSTVETELLRHPGVEQAAALVHDGDVGEARLVAYVAAGDVGEAERTALGAVLRERLAATVPAHLVPWAVIALPTIPLNGNGKVDRSALPVAKVPRNVWNDYVAPSDALEERLAAVWSDALDVEPVGVSDNFFELGGHSPLAAELLVALQREFDVTLPARTLYLRPTIADLAEELRPQGGRGAADPPEETIDAAVR